MENITQLYQEATTPPLSEEARRQMQAKAQALAQEIHNQGVANEAMRAAWKNVPFSQKLVAEVTQRMSELDQHASYIAAAGHPSNEMLRAAVVEKLAMQKIIGFIEGHITTLNPRQQTETAVQPPMVAAE